ncbi:MAG: oxidoreductase [Chloroflexota bacterium]
MKKRFIGGLLLAAAGVGIAAYLKSQRSSSPTQDDVWTTADIPDLTGKVAIVTGANSGLGFETSKELARKGATVIMACRNQAKAQSAFDEIKAEIPNANIELMTLDLASLDSIEQFVKAFKEKYQRLDQLINNAGIMMVPYGHTVDGFERQFGTNHLGHFALTGQLMDLIKSTAGARVVNVSSMGHRMGTMDFDNLMYEGGHAYSPALAYGRSKLANLLFTKGLQNKFNANGIDAMAVSAHPGGSNTNLAGHMEDQLIFKIIMPIFERIMQSAAMGALPQIRAAVDPNVKGGDYYGPNGFMEQTGYPVLVQSNDASHNQADTNQLWQVSESLTGIKY